MSGATASILTGIGDTGVWYIVRFPELIRELGVLKHLPGLLVGALLLYTLPLQVSHLQLLKPA